MSKIHNILVKVPPNSTIEFSEIKVTPINTKALNVNRNKCFVHEMSIIHTPRVTKLTDTGDSYYACLLYGHGLYAFITSPGVVIDNLRFCTVEDIINLPEHGESIFVDKFNITVLSSMSELSRYHIDFSDNTAFYVLDGELYIRYREVNPNPT